MRSVPGHACPGTGAKEGERDADDGELLDPSRPSTQLPATLECERVGGRRALSLDDVPPPTTPSKMNPVRPPNSLHLTPRTRTPGYTNRSASSRQLTSAKVAMTTLARAASSSCEVHTHQCQQHQALQRGAVAATLLPPSKSATDSATTGGSGKPRFLPGDAAQPAHQYLRRRPLLQEEARKPSHASCPDMRGRVVLVASHTLADLGQPCAASASPGLHTPTVPSRMPGRTCMSLCGSAPSDVSGSVPRQLLRAPLNPRNSCHDSDVCTSEGGAGGSSCCGSQLGVSTPASPFPCRRQSSSGSSDAEVDLADWLFQPSSATQASDCSLKDESGRFVLDAVDEYEYLYLPAPPVVTAGQARKLGVSWCGR